MVRTIIFDFDGTIADTFDFTVRQIVKSLKKTRLSYITENDIRIKLKTKNYRDLISEFKISWLMLPFILLTFRKRQEELYQELDRIRIFPGIKNLLSCLKKQGYSLGILSSNLKNNIERFFEINDLKIFDFVHCDSNLFGKDKAIKKLIRKYKLNKEEVIYVADEVRDIEACQKAGIKIISVTWGFNKREILEKHKPDFIVDRPEEILTICRFNIYPDRT